MEVQYTKSREYVNMANANLQFPIEEEINLEQQMPDMESILGQNFIFSLGQTTKSDGKVCISGELQYQILYAPVKGEHLVMGIKGSFPVSQCLMLEYDPQSDVDVSVDVSSVTIKRMNSRKLSVFVLLDAKARAGNVCERQFIEDISMEVEKKSETIKSNELISRSTVPISVKDIINLPSNRPDIGRILFQKVQVRGVELQLTQGAVWMKGEAFIFLIYESDQEEPRVEYLEITTPIEGQTECQDCQGAIMTDSSYKTISAEVNEAPNEDGEIRDLHLNVEMDIFYEQYNELEFPYLRDAYSLKEKLVAEYRNMKFSRIINQQMMRVKVSDFFKTQGEERLLTVYPIGGNLILSDPEVVYGGVLIEGSVIVDLMYIGTTRGQCPMMSQVTIPFHQQMNVTEIKEEEKENIRVMSYADIAQLSASIIDGTQAEIKCVLNLNTTVYYDEDKEVMVDVKTLPLEPEKRPGMVGYIIGKNDSLWELAKENRTTVEAIKTVNDLKTDELKEGMRILVCQGL